MRRGKRGGGALIRKERLFYIMTRGWALIGRGRLFEEIWYLDSLNNNATSI